MNLAKYTAALMGAFSLSASFVQGQLVSFLSFSDIKRYKQVGPEDFDFEGGEWNVLVSDGTATVVGCSGNGAPFPTFPNILCPLGTTALVDAGDLDFDGVRDGGLFYSVSSIIPAAIFAPFRSNLFSFEAGPPSKLPRPIGGTNFRDDSIVLFYDYINAPQSLDRYEITNYVSSREYAPSEFDKQVEEIVPGVYQFRLARQGVDFNDPSQDPYVFVSVTHLEMLEAYPGLSFVPVGNEFRVAMDERWRDGAVEFDPRLSTDFFWDGFNGQTVLASDTTLFSIKEQGTDFTVFPPYFRGIDPFTGLPLVPEALRFPQEVPPLSDTFTLGPFFFAPGEQLYAEVEFQRNFQGTALTLDRSRRSFRWDLNLVDSYEGFRISDNFPERSLDELTAANADFDGDGMTNLEEFALQTDPADPASVSTPTPVIDQFTGQCVLTIPKRPNIGNSLTYRVQYSFDLVNWTTITSGDPLWTATENDNEYTVISNQSSPPANCITRVLITTN
ncbi:MAG: hypothetical protein ISR39_03550 [Akkermansiaceae bacterium]|nr:hypothetical protein [Akkermansiaceae bacterium]